MRSPATNRRVEMGRRKLARPENWTRLQAGQVPTPLGLERGAWAAVGDAFRLTMRVARADEVQELEGYQTVTLYIAALPIGHVLSEKGRIAPLARISEHYEVVRLKRVPNGGEATLDYAILAKVVTS